MIRRIAAAASGALIAVTTAPLATAEPVPDVAPPPPPAGAVASEAPGFVVTPDGWELTVGAQDETQVAIAPLTTAASTREYLVGGTFTGSVKGDGSAPVQGGTLEVGYQIGCGIELNVVKLNGSVGFQPSVGPLGLGNTNIPVTAQMEVFPQPGEVITSTVTTKSFEGTAPRVTLKEIHIKIDGCIGQSFLRSYAILTSSTETADDIVAYYGIAKVV